MIIITDGSTASFYADDCYPSMKLYSYDSVNSKRAHPTHPPSAFVIFVWKSCKCPTVGPGGLYKNPTEEL